MSGSKMAAAAPAARATVEWIRDAGLCMGCGACEGVCPVDGAIQIRRDKRRGIYLPHVDGERCTACGLCLQVCPGAEVEIEQMAAQFLDGANRERELGTFHTCHIGYATARDVRFNAASGGLTTALLVYGLENNLLDGALVLSMSELSPLETQPILATTPEQVIAASGSKYCPAAVNTALRLILAREGRYAVVGLPCHIHAIRKAEKVIPKLARRIVLHLGIFCANNNTYLGTEYFLRAKGILPEQVRQIRYRAEGWPGNICVALDDGQRVIPRGTTEKKWYRRALFSSAFHFDFMIPRCLLCPDQTCELADISLGDPWLRELTRVERVGKSLVVVRNQVGAAYLAKAVESGAIYLEEVALELVKRAQNYAFKARVGGRIRLRQILGRPVPAFAGRDLSCRWGDVWAGLRYLTSHISYHRWLWPVLRVWATLHYATRMLTGKIGGVSRRIGRLLGRGSERTAAVPATPSAAAPRIGWQDDSGKSREGVSLKVLLTGARLSHNLGGPSLLVSTRKLLDEYLPGAAYTFISPSPQDLELADMYDMAIIPAVPKSRLLLAALLRALLGRSPRLPGVQKVFQAFEEADVVVDISGIAFADPLSGASFVANALAGLDFAVAKLFRKPVAKYTADLGPFQFRWNRFFARLYLQRAVDIILARSETTIRRLQQLGVTTPVRFSPDTAFLLEPQPSPLAQELAGLGSPIVGLSASHMARRQSGDAERYLDNMAGLADHVVESTGARIVLIPNEFSRDIVADDLRVAREVASRMRHKESSTVVPDIFTAQQLKGIIQQCDVVVAARYHTIVASLSLGIPVLAVGWHAKYADVLDLFGQGKYLCAVDRLTLDDLRSKFDELWRSREEVGKQIQAAVPGVREMVRESGAWMCDAIARIAGKPA